MAVASARARLKGKPPKLSASQQQHLLKLYDTEEKTVPELAELFSVSRATVYRVLDRHLGRLYSLTDPNDSLLSRVCTGQVSSIPSGDWAYSDDEDHRRRFVWLLKAALEDQMRPVLRSSQELTWVAATNELPVVIAIPGTSNTRAIVKAYFRDDGSTRYIRHLAFTPVFACYGDQWYLELTPTYHFTRDGREPDFNAPAHRPGIKRQERHSDFRRNVDTLARVLRGDVDLGGLAPDAEHQILEFGELEQVRLDTGDEDQHDSEHDIDDDEHDVDDQDHEHDDDEHDNDEHDEHDEQQGG